MTITVLTREQLDECAAIREAAKGCVTVLASPATVEQARRIIKVIAGSEVDLLVISVPGDREELEAYARGLGIAPLFVDAHCIREFEDKTA